LGISIIIISIAVSAIIITCGFVAAARKKESKPWVLHSYGNNIALFNGDEIVEVYGSITVDMLPAEDKRLLDNGIAFITKEEALRALEDYDG
ncbi:MAG: hypothetical protein ACOYJS_05755, partial [Acutalibacteraceae bacterium]